MAEHEAKLMRVQTCSSVESRSKMAQVCKPKMWQSCSNPGALPSHLDAVGCHREDAASRVMWHKAQKVNGALG
jgi:hypothetical protein